MDWADEDEDAEDQRENPVLGDENGWLGVILYDVPKGMEISVEISSDGWLKPSKFETVTERRYKDVIVIPKARYDYDALRKIREQKPVNLNIKVTLDGGDPAEDSETLIMRSVNECPWAVVFGEDEPPSDLSWLFAAFVNENHPWIDGILKETLEGGLIDSFTGYQSGDPDVVLAQVFAIWNTLQRKGIRYSDISTAPPAKHTYSQVVRFLDDSVIATQANCVDGSVLLASILTKIGLSAYLVIVPGHCYLAFDTNPESDENEILGLETTMLGNNKLSSVEKLKENLAKIENKDVKGLLGKELAGKVKKEVEDSRETFLNALSAATEDLVSKVDQFEDEEDIQHELISIAEARELGIMPISSGK